MNSPIGCRPGFSTGLRFKKDRVINLLEILDSKFESFPFEDISPRWRSYVTW